MNVAGIKAWALWFCLALGVGLTALAVRAPPTQPTSASPTVFSAERAMADVRLIGSEPHPIGSQAHARVLAALVQHMTALGLSPSIHTGLGVDDLRAIDTVAAGTVRDIVAVVPGRDRAAPALLLMAHYDNVPNSPGAADDAAGVATVLETVRALRAAGPPARDVILLLTDGEEAGLLGADAFFHDDPLAKRVGVTLNFETRGDAGRAAMFETGPLNGALIRLYGARVAHPFANALTSFLYHHLPNDTDFTHVVRRGGAGLNFAFIDDQLAYHTPLATPAHLSRKSLQHMGDQALAMAGALSGATTLPPRTADRTYFDVFGRGFVDYPPGAGWLVVLAAAILIGAAWVGAGRRRPGVSLWLGDVAQGAGVAITATLTAALVLMVSGRLLDGAGYRSGYHLFRAFDLLFAGQALLAVGGAVLVYVGATRGRGWTAMFATVLVVTVVSCVRGFDPVTIGLAVVTAGLGWIILRRPLGLRAAWIGALIPAALAAGVLQALAPTTAWMFAWPTLLAAAACLAPIFLNGRPWLAGAVAAGVAVLSFVFLGSLAQAMFVAIGPGLPAVLALFVFLLLASFAPFLSAWAAMPRAGWATAIVGLIGVGMAAAVGLGHGTPARPALTSAFYYAEPAARRWLFVSPDPALDRWSVAVMRTAGGAPGRASLPPFAPRPVWTSPAPATGIIPPNLALKRTAGGVVAHVAPSNGGRALMLFFRSAAAVERISVGARDVSVSPKPGQWGLVIYNAPPSKGVDIRLESATVAPLDALALEQIDGWPPGLAMPRKPADLMAWRDSDTTILAARARVN